MNSKRKYIDALVFLLLGSLYVYSISLSVLASTVLEMEDVALYAIGLVFLLCFLILFYNRYTFIFFTILTLAAALVLYRMLKEESPAIAWYYDLWNYLSVLVLFIRGYLPYSEEYRIPLIYTISFCISLFTTLSFWVYFNFYFLAVLGLSTFVLNWIMDYPRSDFAYLLFLICFLVLLVKKMNLMSLREKRRRRFNGVFTLSAIPFCALAVGIASLLPTPSIDFRAQPLEVTLRKPIMAVSDFFYLAFNPKYFSFQTTGFTGRDGRLGGRINISDRNVMRVYTEKSPYLAGAVKDTYTGHSWTKAEEVIVPYEEGIFGEETGMQSYTVSHGDVFFVSYEDGMFGNEAAESNNNVLLYFLQYLYSSFRNPALNGSTYARALGSEGDFGITRVTIDIGDARTASLFRPMKSGPLYSEQPMELSIDSYGDLRTEQLMEKNTAYSYFYTDIPCDDLMIIEMLKASYKGFYEDRYHAYAWERFRGSEGNIPNENAVRGVQRVLRNFYREAASTAQSVYEAYTALPEELPERVYDLTHEITADCESDYDKIQALVEYLIEMPYTLAPESVPREADFVDYFLFEGREGYCTYYASALAVMARIEGLPSRYVEGYIMPSRRDESGAFVVTNRQAHSWAEIYFEGFGWVPFEATAPFNYALYNRQAPEESLYSPSMANYDGYEDYLDEMGLMSENPAASDVPIPDATALAEEDNPGKGSGGFQVYALAMLALLLPGIVYIGYRIIKVKCHTRKMMTLSNRERAVEYFKEIIKFAKYYGYELKASETAVQYANRLGEGLVFSDGIRTDELAAIFSKAKYSEGSISEAELETMKQAYDTMLEKLRQAMSRIRFMILLYIQE